MARTHREFVMLADNFSNAERTNIGQWYWSEKLDGMRALWIPVTRELEVEKIGFANNDRKDHKLDRVGKLATGLWSRYGNVINAPSSFLDQLPIFPVDGELYLGRGRFQELMGYVKKDNPLQKEWDQVEYRIFDAPTHTQIFTVGTVNNPNYKKRFQGNPYPGAKDLTDSSFFMLRLRALQKHYADGTPPQLKVHEQHVLPVTDAAARDYVTRQLLEISKSGGEGVIIRNSMSEWEPIRSKHMLKLKPINDSEGTVIGRTDGKGRLEGMMGALLLQWGNVQFELSGWTDYERQHHQELFPDGTNVTFVYRELTDDGKPKEARYLRKRVQE